MPTDIRLLLVEDSELDSELLLREFYKAGFNPVYCRVDNKASLDDVLQEKWDLAITDYQLPGIDGLPAVMSLQKVDPNLPVIMVSGRIGEETAVDIMRAGARDCVMKDNLQTEFWRLSPQSCLFKPTYSSRSTHTPNDCGWTRSSPTPRNRR